MLCRSVGAVLGLVAATAQLAAGQFPIASTLNSWMGNAQQMYPTTVKFAEVVYTPNSAKGFKTTADHDGNVISSGRFKQWASFGPFNLTSPNANSAAWIVKQGPEGEYLWAETIIIAESANAEAHALTTDKDGNIYLAIGASGQTTVGGMSINVPAQGPSQFSSIGQLVAKLNPSGQAVWLEAFGDVVMQGSAVDPTGQYYYLVMASARPSFSLGGSTFTQVGSGTNMYLMKMSTADGSVLWARQYAASTGSVSDFFTAAVNFLDMDSAGNLYIGSFFTDNFDTGLGSYGPLTGGGSFVVKVSSSGTTLGAVTVCAGEASAIRVGGPENTVYVLGRFNDGMTVDTNPPTEFKGNQPFQYSGNPVRYIWLVTLDTSLTLQKAQQYGAMGNPYEAQMWVDKDGSAYLGGDFFGLISFGYQVVDTHRTGVDEIYLLKVDPSLNVVWARSFGGRNTDELLSITGNDRYVFFTGTMRSDSSGPVITGPNYFDSFVLVGYPFGTDQPFLALAYKDGNAGPCSNLGLIKLQATKRAVAGRPMRIQVAVRNRGAPKDRVLRELKYHKNDAADAASSDCEGLLVTVTLPAGLTYLPGKTTRSAKASAYNATVADGVLTWRGPAPAHGKTQKLQAQFTVASSAATGPIYVTAGAQCLNSAGAPTCTAPTTTAEVMVKGAKAAKL